MLRIRLTRVGKKKQPTYRIVVIEKKNARDGSFIEIVGHYNPRQEPAAITMKTDRIQYWLSKGAQPSDTVRSFIRAEKRAQKIAAASA